LLFLNLHGLKIEAFNTRNGGDKKKIEVCN